MYNNTGIEIILFLQGLGDWLIGPMRALSFLGNEQFYLFVAPVVYWCVSARLGLRMGLLLMISGGISEAFKLTFYTPRPYWVDPQVNAWSVETSFGLPSGHAQHAVAVWGTIAAWVRRGWAWAASLGLILLIGVSRLFLGVHFPSHVLLGWLLGFLILALFLRLETPVATWLGRKSLGERILAVFFASLVLILPGALARLALGAWVIPAGWVEMAARAAPQADPIQPLALSTILSNAGAFFGLAAGHLLVQTRGGFDAGGPGGQRVSRFLLGVAGVLLIWSGLGAVFPRGEYLLAYLLRYLRYALIGIWITGLAPLIFIQLRLTRSPDRPEFIPYDQRAHPDC